MCVCVYIYMCIYIYMCVYIYVALGTIAKVCPYYIFLIALYKIIKKYQ